jgi:hypothetical protein
VQKTRGEGLDEMRLSSNRINRIEIFSKIVNEILGRLQIMRAGDAQERISQDAEAFADIQFPALLEGLVNGFQLLKAGPDIATRAGWDYRVRRTGDTRRGMHLHLARAWLGRCGRIRSRRGRLHRFRDSCILVRLPLACHVFDAPWRKFR